MINFAAIWGLGYSTNRYDNMLSPPFDLPSYRLLSYRLPSYCLPSYRRTIPAVLRQNILQLTVLIKLGDDVTAADKFAVDIELRNGRPVGVLFDRLP